jgi:hypothetical protein
MPDSCRLLPSWLLLHSEDAMKDFELEYDAKTHSFSIEHSNILKEYAKKYADTLIIKPFQIGVQIAMQQGADVPDPEAVEEAMELVACEAAEEVFAEIDDLNARIVKLQKEEQLGNEKAADEAEKEVKAAKKRIDKLAAEVGADMRQKVEAALKKQKVEKPKLRSTSRTGLRGLELNEDAFEGGVDSKASAFVGEVGKGLAGLGGEALKLSNEEKTNRQGLADAVKTLKGTLDKYVEQSVKKGGQDELDIELWAKNNVKEVDKMEQLKEKYVDFLQEFEKKLNSADGQLDKFDKLIKQEDALKEDKGLAKDLKAFKEARDTILGTFKDKYKAASLVDRLFMDDYRKGATFIAAYRALEAQKGTTKSAKTMQDAGKAIEKAAKE